MNWGPGPPGPNPTDPALLALLRQLARIQEMQQQNDQRRSIKDREDRFKITRSIPKINGADARTILEEFEAFEEEVIKTEPTTAKQWYQALEDALDGPARTWRDHVS